jgi:hypothetical protein
MLSLFVQFLCLLTSIYRDSPAGTVRVNHPINDRVRTILATALLAKEDAWRDGPLAQQPKQGWQYAQKGGSAKATLRSVNAIQFAYPYTQKENVTLGIRSRSGDTYLYLESTNGLFTRSFQNGTAQVQFDQQRPVTYALSAAANGRANIVFFDDSERLLSQLRKARIMSVRLRFAGQTDRVIQFQPGGLRWER